MSGESFLWIVFAVLIPVMLFLDLGVFHRRAHAIGVKEALIWSAVWISLAFIFAAGIFIMVGSEKALAFIAGYLVEESLSVDNLFVFLLIFSYFCVPEQYRHRVLFWGIVGAVVMRGFFILTGLALLERLHWIVYVFGVFLIYTGGRIALKKEGEVRPEKNPAIRLFRRFVPMTRRYHAQCFMINRNGRCLATPLLLVLVMIETTDIVFAVDSVPAVLAITRDPFIVYTSNIFAILGLRSIFFALSGVIRRLYYLNYGLAVILIFLGIKMVGSEFFEVQVGISLGIVVGILFLAALASLLFPRRGGLPGETSGGDENDRR